MSDRSWKAEVLVSGKWYSNGLRFTVESEAREYGLDLFMRWTTPEDWRTAKSDEAPNRCYRNGRAEPLESRDG